jgi:hypothetical protein
VIGKHAARPSSLYPSNEGFARFSRCGILLLTRGSTQDLPHSYREASVAADTPNKMQNQHAHAPGTLADASLDRLLRDLNALGRLHVRRRHATERLTAKLGDVLLRAINAELHRLDAGALPVGSRRRRVA